jgi:hypothetical protein
VPELKRLDTPEKTNGTGIFGIDVQVPGMLVAVVARPPVFGGKVVRFDATEPMRVAAVRAVVQVPSGVAVIAGRFWPAKLGREKLDLTWDEGSAADFNSESQRQQYAQLAQQPGLVARKDGDHSSALSLAAKKIRAAYEAPYLSHAMMEPLNCAVDLRADHCEIWTGTQYQLGILCGIAFGAVDVLMTLLGEHPERATGILLQAFSSRFAIGFLAANVSLRMHPALAGAIVGLLISLPDAFALKSYVGIIGTGLIFGALAGWAAKAWAH